MCNLLVPEVQHTEAQHGLMLGVLVIVVVYETCFFAVYSAAAGTVGHSVGFAKVVATKYPSSPYTPETIESGRFSSPSM